MLANAIEAYKAVLRKPEFLDKENEILEAKRQELLEMTRVIFQNENISFDTKLDQEKQIEEIAKLQARLDVYAYTNRKDLDGTRKRIAELNGLENKAENREELLKEIEDLRTKYKVFGRYVEDKDWEDLYMAKFEVLMSDINQREESPLKDAQIDTAELEYYRRIVQEKIKEIINGRNEELKRAFGKERLAEAVKLIEDILKDGKKQFDVEQILQNSSMLRLILAFDRPDGLEKMTLNRDEAIAEINPDFKWIKIIPLKSIFQVTQLKYDYLVGEINTKSNLYAALYRIHNEHLKEENINLQESSNDGQKLTYTIPEGITEICPKKRRYRIQPKPL